MAGDWMKICKDTPDKPEVLAIATRLKIHPDMAFARCFRLWSWFDTNTTDGVTSGVTKITLDALLNRDGLCDAMIEVSWLGETEDGNLFVPNFDYHISDSAKTRAQAAKRQDKHRKNSGEQRDKSNGVSVTSCVTLALPEKRREEEVNTTTREARFDFKGELVALGVSEDVARDFVATRKAKKLAQTETAFRHIVKEAGVAGISLDDAIHICCKRGWGGFESKWLKPEDKVSSVSWKDNPLLAGAI